VQIPVDIGYAAVIRRLARHEIPQLIAASASGRIAVQPHRYSETSKRWPTSCSSDTSTARRRGGRSAVAF
jgi:hypothetical protein